ncbi:MAG TPA: bifunctional DNA-formamidopyrimidine glycosylase/DNA-(apurinic or apyrimidinic site) lyase [Steroidobacteraceae bacterium]|nr:bifunctional DNA-formamidopyrimidine glycosylase/DNA-(apurinic or apyrimidinic site) lyase [Steroidobacteraceae bacterium]
MPELPEVETTRRGLAPHVRGRRIRALKVYERRLRWPVAAGLPAKLAGQRILSTGRRGKYLLLKLGSGALILHLGMSGNLRLVPAASPRVPHDHFDLVLDSGRALRFNDPRRFGSLLYVRGDPLAHRLLAHLGPEPFSREFDAEYLWRVTRGRRVAVKQLLMNSRLVVGVGNIYASEALFRARIRPQRAARSLTHTEAAQLVRAVRAVLGAAIRAGGTTLRDYRRTDGSPGYFRQRLYVYERHGKPCRRCGKPVRAITQGQRSTYYCPGCQK